MGDSRKAIEEDRFESRITRTPRGLQSISNYSDEQLREELARRDKARVDEANKAWAALSHNEKKDAIARWAQALGASVAWPR